MKELDNDSDIVPLWKLAEQKGVRYCIMNVPTTTPVPEVKNGIVVGSLGGGSEQNQRYSRDFGQR